MSNSNDISYDNTTNNTHEIIVYAFIFVIALALLGVAVMWIVNYGLRVNGFSAQLNYWKATVLGGAIWLLIWLDERT